MKALLAAAAVAAIGLTAAPAAQATWMTGMGNLPIFASDQTCRDGMDFRYATHRRPPGPAQSAPAPNPGPVWQQTTQLGVQVKLPLALSSLGVWVRLPDGSI